MWQLRRLSTSEPLSDVGPLPNNWGPIFGLHGIQERLGDLSWLGPDYEDLGWLELTEADIRSIKESEAMSRVDAEKALAVEALNDPNIVVGDKIAWNEYLLALDTVCLCPDLDCDPKFPIRPDAQVSS